jgi:hypothetical protein
LAKRTADLASEPSSPTIISLAVHIVDADQEWEFCDVTGKEFTPGEIHYWVDWNLTLVPKHLLRNANGLVHRFEARLQARRESQHGNAVDTEAIASQNSEPSNSDDSSFSNDDLVATKRHI